MKTEIAQLFDELRQICAQYAAEVPGKRRPWPESIKTRVLRLRFLGFSNHRIAQETGIPIMTLYSWKMPSDEKARALPAPGPGDSRTGEFTPIRVVRRRTGLPARGRPGPIATDVMTVKTSNRQNCQKPPTVTVVHPSGLRLEGLTVEQAIEVARRLGR